jgi:hypothetical protein
MVSTPTEKRSGLVVQGRDSRPCRSVQFGHRFRGYRDLAAANPAFTPALAGSLNNPRFP